MSNGIGRGTPGSARLEPGPGANARQVGGGHYSGSAYQHWDYAVDLNLCHLEGAATKYLARAGNKAGEPREKDLEKALHYLEKLVEVYQANRIPPLINRQGAGLSIETIVARFIANSVSGQAFTPRAVAVLTILSRWSSLDELNEAVEYLTAELDEEKRKPKAAPPAEERRAATNESRAIIDESPRPRGL